LTLAAAARASCCKWDSFSGRCPYFQGKKTDKFRRGSKKNTKILRVVYMTPALHAYVCCFFDAFC
jgi:hypothetical protein